MKKINFKIFSLLCALIIVCNMGFIANVLALNGGNDATEYKTLPENGTAYGNVGVISDVHISDSSQRWRTFPLARNVDRLKRALKIFDRNNVKTILLTGDFVNFGREPDYRLLNSVLLEYYGSYDNAPEIVWNFGNHEITNYEAEDWGTTEAVYSTSSHAYEYLSRWTKNYEMYNGLSGEDKKGAPIFNVKSSGINIVSVNPVSTYSFDDSAVQEFRTLLTQVTAQANGMPVIVGMHYPINETLVSGMIKTNYTQKTGLWAMHEVMEEFPQIIVFSGHMHTTPLHARAITQSEGYTHIMAGSLSFNMLPEIDNSVDANNVAYNYDNMVEAGQILGLDGLTKNYQRDSKSHCMVVSFQKDKALIDRYDIDTGRKYETVTPWEIPYNITAENKDEKFHYVHSKMAAGQQALTFEENAESELAAGMPNYGVMRLTFPSVKQVNEVEGYRIELTKNGEETITKYWASTYWKGDFAVPTYNAYIYEITDCAGWTVKIYPIDFYGKEYEPLVKTF